MYCDLSNYHSLLNSFNKYDFVCQEFEMSCILIRGAIAFVVRRSGVVSLAAYVMRRVAKQFTLLAVNNVQETAATGRCLLLKC